MNNKLKSALALFLSTQAMSVEAVTTGNLLNFNAGTASYSSGTYSVTGSYFAMDSDGNGVFAMSERTAIAPGSDGGVVVGVSQLSSLSHGGVPDGTEISAIDQPWAFGANTGMHYSMSPTNILTDDDARNVTLDFSGWGITWNGIPEINMGGGTQDCGTASDGICVAANGDDVSGVFDNGTGFATVTCGFDCAVGDTFILNYAARVPRADSSGFSAVNYSLHLEGTVKVAAVPIPAAFWLFGSGLLGLATFMRRRK